jgi:U3 small nucleolar ribonucleoprotein component
MTGGAAVAAQEALKTKHREIDDLMALLDSRINSLTNFHFTPAAPKEELSVVTNVSSLHMEDGKSYLSIFFGLFYLSSFLSFFPLFVL